MDEDAALTEQVAADYVRSRGEDSIGYLVERAETAEASGDDDSAYAWRQLAAAAGKLLRLLQAS